MGCACRWLMRTESPRIWISSTPSTWPLHWKVPSARADPAVNERKTRDEKNEVFISNSFLSLLSCCFYARDPIQAELDAEHEGFVVGGADHLRSASCAPSKVQ